MGSEYRYRSGKIPLFTQAIKLKQAFPESSIRQLRRQVLVWEGQLQPSALSDTYQIRIRYRLGRRPLVTVYGDNLQRIDDPALPHHFHVDPKRKQIEMCLHLPGEFNDRMLLVKTILPWASEWLLHYEIWLATGEWYGGGVHPEIHSSHKARKEEGLI